MTLRRWGRWQSSAHLRSARVSRAMRKRVLPAAGDECDKRRRPVGVQPVRRYKRCMQRRRQRPQFPASPNSDRGRWSHLHRRSFWFVADRGVSDQLLLCRFVKSEDQWAAASALASRRPAVREMRERGALCRVGRGRRSAAAVAPGATLVTFVMPKWWWSALTQRRASHQSLPIARHPRTAAVAGRKP